MGRSPLLSLLKFVNPENYLSDNLGVKVDRVHKAGLKPRIEGRDFGRGRVSVSKREVEASLQEILDVIAAIGV